MYKCSQHTMIMHTYLIKHVRNTNGQRVHIVQCIQCVQCTYTQTPYNYRHRQETHLTASTMVLTFFPLRALRLTVMFFSMLFCFLHIILCMCVCVYALVISSTLQNTHIFVIYVFGFNLFIYLLRCDILPFSSLLWNLLKTKEKKVS